LCSVSTLYRVRILITVRQGVKISDWTFLI
jgi:hypothetical protein